MNIAVAGLSVCGGVLITPSQQFFTVNGKPVIRSGDMVLPHPPFHPTNPVIGTRHLTCQGIQVCRVGDIESLGHPITTGEFATLS